MGEREREPDRRQKIERGDRYGTKSVGGGRKEDRSSHMETWDANILEIWPSFLSWNSQFILHHLYVNFMFYSRARIKQFKPCFPSSYTRSLLYKSTLFGAPTCHPPLPLHGVNNYFFFRWHCNCKNNFQILNRQPRFTCLHPFTYRRNIASKIFRSY